MSKYVRLLSFVMLLFMMVPFMSGCVEEDSALEAQATVNQMFSRLQNDSPQEVKEFLGITGKAQFLSDETIALLLENLEYTINSSTVVDDTTVDVRVSITNIDMTKVFDEYSSQLISYIKKNADKVEKMSEEDIKKKAGEMFNECLANNEWDTITLDANIRVEKNDGYWDITPEEVLVNALFGGVFTAPSEMLM
ncbi:MAG: hypothetical protein IKB73_03890 [Ruminococcus sp.]|nr:hypothetical protein [Ruminococcus sp.]